MQRNIGLSSLKSSFSLKISLILLLCWVVFNISWIIIFASTFSLYVHLGVSLLSLLIFIGLITFVWIYWMKRFIPQIGFDFLKTMNIFKMIIITIMIPFMILILLSIYLIFFADSFSLLQNVALIIIMFLSIFLSITFLWKRSKLSPFQFVKQSANPFNSFQQQDNPWK
ncbi:MAG TPA: hypothetical protein VKP59_02740 [Candidatus Thermoplasmatota archaeon]|nr:hypothetical protein [Candidatus Thermoplasmatota archaeon]